MKIIHSYRDMRRAELRTVGWFFATMAMATVTFVMTLVGHYVLGWW